MHGAIGNCAAAPFQVTPLTPRQCRYVHPVLEGADGHNVVALAQLLG